MLCHDLTRLWNHKSPRFSPSSLLAGSFIIEPKVRPECQISGEGLDFIHSGKDASIIHLLNGGSGFPPQVYLSHVAQAAFDMGCAQERRDLNALKGVVR